MKTMKLRIVILLTIVMLAVFSVTGPALALGTAQTMALYGGHVVAAPGGSGTPLELRTATKGISGTARQYVKLPAKITNTSNRTVKETVAYVSLVDVTKGQQAPVDLE